MKRAVLVLISLPAVLTFGCADSTEPEHAQKVYAIVDVMTLNNYEYAPEGYTGIAFSNCTEPYIPPVTGSYTTPSDVNIGIGGDTKFIYVKFEELDLYSDVPVLVDIEVAHWPYWQPAYPEGWEPAGPLTTGTWSDCWRNGLNVRYVPIRQTDHYIATICLSITGSGNANSCPVSIVVDDQLCPREASWLDIHKDCGDDNYVFVSYYRPTIAHKEEPEWPW